MNNPEDLLLATFYLEFTHPGCAAYWGCPPWTRGRQVSLQWLWILAFNSNTFQPKFQEVHFFPSSLTQLRIEDDIRQFMEDTAKIFHDTGFPIFPWVLILMLLGFSLCFVDFGGLFIILSVLSFVLMMLPIFIQLYYLYQRKSKLSKIVVSYNNQKFLEKGFYVGKKSCFIQLLRYLFCMYIQGVPASSSQANWAELGGWCMVVWVGGS